MFYLFTSFSPQLLVSSFYADLTTTGGNETANFINTLITKIPKLDNIVDFSACNKTFGTTTPQ
jgi:hypothetical protein